ncbi:ferric/cupric-chelate reductase [Gamsiella multidivaricata]|nr:ferric/cupric-chelate reductase [Gamsiella multidivaricata]
MKFQTLALSFTLVFTLYLVADFTLTWLGGSGSRDIYYYNKRDLYFVTLFILPAIASHLVTIWGHYYRADNIFRESIAKVSTATASERKKIGIWERHDPWFGFTVRYWMLVLVSVLLNLVWFLQPIVTYLPQSIKFLGVYGAITAYLAFGCGYAAMGSCGMLLLLVLRRSMLQALGFTYADILPLHRWMGVAFIFWGTVHMVSYILYYVHFDAFWRNFNFDGNTRGPQNMIALFAYVALLGLGFTAIPQIRRSCYLLFITTHRIFTVIVFLGTLMHFPYYMIWYYVLPSVCLYLADRFVPKFIQSCSIARKVECTLNKEADIMTLVMVSRNRLEPLKPYYPGDYVNVEIPELSSICHPFTIASYWAEDPYSMTLYIRTFQETRTSWTGALANMCEESEETVLVEANIDGAFGDRNHDYLSTNVMVIFAAGAAITSFMSLLKAIAAQIEAAEGTMDNPATIQVYLIGTFRYESELYAYGDFMHRITHDPRFTSWLHTELYVSRPDKYTPPAECPSGECTSEFVCGRVDGDDGGKAVNESTSLLAKGRKLRYGAAEVSVNGCDGCGDGKGCCMEAASSSSSSSMTITNAASACSPITIPVKVDDTPAEIAAMYQYKSLPTFEAASSATIATVHAKKDLVATTIMLVVPMRVFPWSRTIPWAGAVLGYLGLWAARNTNLWQSRSSGSITDTEAHSAGDGGVKNAYRNLVQGLSGLDTASPRPVKNTDLDNRNRVKDVHVAKGTIPFKRGRIQVNHHIQELKALGIGREDGCAMEVEEARRGGVLVFGGGPDAFVDMIEESCKKARWQVDFHRETWAP